MTMARESTAGDAQDLSGRLPAEVVIPLRWDGTRDRGGELTDLASYLSWLVARVDVTVVDGSERQSVHYHRAVFPVGVRVIRPIGQGRNGKVLGAVTGIRAARHELVILADDDVRYDWTALTAVLAALADADIVRPQNVYRDWPWCARWDMSRALIARTVGADWPGTFGVRQSAVTTMGGWDPDVLFENLEMLRTARGAGRRVANRPGIVVSRSAPSSRQFWSQRLRQAYDDLAQPPRLVLELAIAPALFLLRRQPRALAVVVLLAVAAAELGRRRFRALDIPADVPLWTPLWLAERGLLVWVALVVRGCGGVSYHGRRLATAAHPQAVLSRRASHGRQV